MRYGSIYMATNTKTGEQYVGQTRQRASVRFYAHMISARKPKFRFAKALAEYGFENFTFEEVASCLSREALNEAEKAFIAEYTPIYNSTKGGAGRPRVVSDDERHRLSEAAKRRWADPEWREKTVASIRKAADTEAYRERGRSLGKTATGAEARWVGHAPTLHGVKDRSKSIAASWEDPAVRERRTRAIIEANKRSEVQARRSMASKGRKQPKSAIVASAKAKWKPVYCPELQVTFLSRLAAAEYIGVGKTAVSEALRHARKVAGKYTLREVCYRL